MRKIIIVLFIGFIAACQIENDQDPISEQDPRSHQDSVFTGIVNQNMIFQAFDGGYSLSYEWSSCGYGDVSDSIDLFNDGDFDILLSARFFNQDLLWSDECCPPPADCWPTGLKFRISMQNDLELAFYDTTMAEGFPGYLASNFSLNTRIDTISNWTEVTHFWTGTFNLYGPWYRIESDNYIAIRKLIEDDYKYGWIRIGPAPYSNLVFKDYAIEQF
jgi:hypothetical protein